MNEVHTFCMLLYVLACCVLCFCMENIKVTFRLKSERDSIYVWDRDFLLSFRVYDHRFSHLDCVMHYTHWQGAQKMRWFGWDDGHEFCVFVKCFKKICF